MAMYGEEKEKEKKEKPAAAPSPTAVQSTATTKPPSYYDENAYNKRGAADAAAANAAEREKQASKLKEAASKTSGAGMPKQEKDEDATTYGARLRKWREEQKSANENQKKALK